MTVVLSRAIGAGAAASLLAAAGYLWGWPLAVPDRPAANTEAAVCTSCSARHQRLAKGTVAIPETTP